VSRVKAVTRAKPGSPARRELDELDHRIIDLLGRDARVSNRQIAEQLDVTEGTVRGRIKRLEQQNSIRFTAVTNVAFAGAPKVVLIGVQAAHGELRALSQRIAAMPEIRCVIVTLGRYDILAIGLFAELEEVVANNRILALPGVRHVETSIAVKTLKYDYRAAKITPTVKGKRASPS
jgi:Lrp/AsnC family transcriptional regulator for asnA, asnC and gidA